MKDKFIRLLKAIGIALLCFGGLFLFIFGFVRYTTIASAVLIALIFIFVVWRIYKDADLQAEEAALEAYPNILFPFTPLDLNAYCRKAFIKGHETAEKDTIERAIAWLKENANKYIVDLTPTYPDAPANIIVGGMCWEHLKDYLQNE